MSPLIYGAEGDGKTHWACVLARLGRYEQALLRIATRSCCGGCQEAARVAQKAVSDEAKKSLSEMRSRNDSDRMAHFPGRNGSRMPFLLVLGFLLSPALGCTTPVAEGPRAMTPLQRGDWVITGVQGEHFPCKPDIFTATYEPIDG